MDVTDRRRQRSRDIIAATRHLFDERGAREAQIDDIATAVGINRAIIYRHFQTKEELFAVTLVEYLDELEVEIAKVSDEPDPVQRFEAQVEAFFTYGVKYPAFVDCAQALLKFRGSDLADQVSLARLTELGQSMYRSFAHVVRSFEDGNAAGVFDVKDPELLVNIIYAQGLGVMNLATFQRSIRELGTGLPIMDALPLGEVLEQTKRAMVAMARPV